MLINSIVVYYCVNKLYTFLSTMNFQQNREFIYTVSDLKKLQTKD